MKLFKMYSNHTIARTIYKTWAEYSHSQCCTVKREVLVSVDAMGEEVGKCHVGAYSTMPTVPVVVLVHGPVEEGVIDINSFTEDLAF